MVVLAYEEETRRAPAPPTQPTYEFSERCRLPGFSDNAAIAKDDVPAGTGIRHNTTTLRLRSTILEGHRFALVPIAEGELITSWGEPFGRALRAIAAGEWLRNANTLRVLRGRPQIADGVLDAATQPNFANYTKPQPELTEAGFVPGPQPPLDARARRAASTALRAAAAAASARAITRCCSASRRARASSRARSSGGWRRRRAARSTASSRSRTPRTAASPPTARRRRRTTAHSSSARCSGCCSTPTSAPHS